MAILEKGEFLKIASKQEAVLRISGVQNGKFILMVDISDTTYICAKNGKHLEFKDIKDILRLLQVDTMHSVVKLEFKNWVGT